jgi:NitT/TauT family transport system ATP-binding protein
MVTAATNARAEAPAAHAAKPILVVDDVSKRFDTPEGPLVAVDRISFTVAPGEFLAVIGPSGCGKSTLFNMIGGLLEDYEGRITVAGETVSGPHAAIGMVFQEESTFPWRSVLDNVAFPLEIAGTPKTERLARAAHFVALVGLAGFERRYPAELSGGMRQRVAIARTLILEPRIILMDEPFGALDPPTRTRMQDHLVALWREQSPTIFFITHSVEEAVFLGDHILMFSSSPGTVLQTLRVPPPDRPSLQMQRDPKFVEVVHGLRDVIEKLESSTRAGD